MKTKTMRVNATEYNLFFKIREHIEVMYLSEYNRFLDLLKIKAETKNNIIVSLKKERIILLLNVFQNLEVKDFNFPKLKTKILKLKEELK